MPGHETQAGAGAAGDLSWRSLGTDDYPLLQRWLREPLVARWWNHDTSVAAIDRDFGPCVRGEDPMQVLLVAHAGEPVAFVQRYRYADEPEATAELAPLVVVSPEAVSMDYLVGPDAAKGQGLGSRILAALAADTWSAYPLAPAIVIAVAAGNRASWRALERAGFRRVAAGHLPPDNPIDPPDHVVYQLDRPRPEAETPTS